MSQIYEKARELGMMIAESNEIKHFKALETVFLGDEEAQKVLNDYQMRREEITKEMRETDMTPETLKGYQEELQACMAKLVENKVVNDYLEAKSAFNNLITQVNTIISFCVEGEQEECGGNCAGCSGCH
ncbi:MAG: YlbF family regulator [Clostridia bacterium]|nr:YlbF family regulator [Clostridia bacterium]